MALFKIKPPLVFTGANADLLVRTLYPSKYEIVHYRSLMSS